MRLLALIPLAALPALAAAQDCSPAGYDQGVGDHNGFCVRSVGRGGWIDIANANFLPLYDMTVEVFFRADRTTGTARLISCKDNTGTGGWAMSLVDGRPRFEFFTGLAAESQTTVEPGRWYRAVASVSIPPRSTRMTLSLYLGNSTDDQVASVGSAVSTVPAGPPSSGFRVGADPSGSNRFFGSVEEVRVFGHAFQEPGAIYGATPGILHPLPHDMELAAVTVLHFSEGSGDTVADASGHGRFGTLFSSTWVPQYTDADADHHLDICQTPCILSGPETRRACPGGEATFAVDAGCTGGAGLEFQWLKDGVEVPGATGASYTVVAVSRADEGVYQARVRNALNPGLSVLTGGAALIVTPPPPTPTVARVDRTAVCAGVGTVTLTAPELAPPGGAADYTCEWRAVSTDGPVVGVGAEVSVPAPGEPTRYYVRAVGPCAATPWAATEVVTPIPNAGPLVFADNRNELRQPLGGSFRRVFGGPGYAVAEDIDGGLQCVGVYNAYLRQTPAGPFVDVACGATAAYGLRADGSVAAWGSNFGGECDVPAGPWRAVAGGTYWAVGVRADGTLAGWGTDSMDAGVLALPQGRFTSVAAAGLFACFALREDGTIAAWGRDPWLSGMLRAPSGSFTRLAVCDGYGLALRPDGTIAAWGQDRLASGVLDVPPGPFVDLQAGRYAAAGQRPDGTWVLWGGHGAGSWCPQAPAQSFAIIGDGFTAAVLAWPITRQPDPVAAAPGTTARFRVELDPTAEVASIQWRRDGAPIDGATGATLEVPASRDAEGLYDCTVRTACGWVASRPALLSISCPPDFNGDGFLDFFDYDDFVTAYESGAPGADFNRDGFQDFFDYDAFIAAFETGC